MIYHRRARGVSHRDGRTRGLAPEADHQHDLTVRSVGGVMRRAATAKKRAILEAALDVLRSAGIDAFSVEGVARRASVAKGLVIYHYGSRAQLLRACATALARERAERFAARRRGGGIRGIDATWEELRRQTSDGTTRAWLGLAAAGVMIAEPGITDSDDVARAGLLDGCAAALAAGTPEPLVREAHDVLWLALLRILEADEL